MATKTKIGKPSGTIKIGKRTFGSRSGYIRFLVKTFGPLTNREIVGYCKVHGMKFNPAGAGRVRNEVLTGKAR